MDFMIQLLNSLQYGLLLFLLASGLTLIFGVMGVINLAHGSFYMLGAYLAWWLSVMLGSFWLALPVAIVVAFAIGAALERGLFAWLYARDHLDQVLLTFGLILVFDELQSLAFGDDVHGVTLPGWLAGSVPLTDTLSYPVYRLFVSGACLAVAVGLWWLIQRTRLGMRVRAGNDNREMTQALGLDIDRLYTLVFAGGVALAALAGMLAAPLSSVYPGMGGSVLIGCFVVVVIGGIGSVKGALIGALLIGLVDTFGKLWLPQLAGALVYVLMAAILLWRPSGLFGDRFARAA